MEPNATDTFTTPLTELFDRHYLAFWQAELGEDRLDRELALVKRLGQLASDQRALDVACGYGRMSNALAAAGLDVTGVDLSDDLLAEARSRARVAGVSPRYLRRDMRDLNGLKGFDCALLWFTSFGYFDDAQNEAVLCEVLKCLVPGGRLLIETRHWDRMHRSFDPLTVRTSGEDFLIEDHDYNPLTGIQQSRQTLLVAGQRLERVAAVRRYSFPELRALCRRAGFTSVDGYDETGGTLRTDSHRCVVVAAR